MKNATDVGLQTWEADVTCGVWCQGGSVRWLKTDHPQYTDASDVWVRGDDAIAALESLRAELAECIVALEKIATPISAMKRALPVGATLNVAMAITLSNDPSYLKEIAKAALAARKGEGE